MPWTSKAQERWGNSPAGKKALGKSGVEEWNNASKGLKLPERSKKQKDSKKSEEPAPILREADFRSRAKR